MKNSPATTRICKLLMQQSALIKKFDAEMTSLISQLMYEVAAAETPEDVHMDLAFEGVEKALMKNVESVRHVTVPQLVNING